MTDAAGLSRSERRRALAGILSCIGVYGITAGLSMPLMSLILEARGYDRTVIGLNSATMAVALLIFSPLVPAIIKRFGFRKLMVVSLLAEAGSFIALALSPNIVFWFVIRVVMGASATGLFLAGETWINQIAVEASRGRVMAVYSTIMAGSFGAGPLLIALTGIDGFLPFGVAAAIVMIAGLPMLFTDNIPPAMEQKASFGVLRFMRLAPTLCAAVFLFAFIEMAVLPLLPVYGLHFGLSASVAAATLTALAAGTIFLQYPIGWLADKMDRFSLLILCGAGGFFGAGLIPFVISHPLLLWPTLFLWGGIFASIYTVALALVGERYKGSDLVTANAAFGVIWGFGSLTGPTLGGVAMDTLGPHGLPLVLSILCGVFVLISLLRQGRNKAGAR
jgi:MFS family permease